MTLHCINTSPDGFSNWVKIHDPDPVTNMHCVEFLTQYKNSKNPEELISQHKIMLNRKDLFQLSLVIQDEV